MNQPMDQLRTLSPAGRLTVAALVLGAIGFVVQMIAGVTDTPTIPPGLVAIVVAAGLVAFAPGRGMPLAGPVAGLFNLIVFLAKGNGDRLGDTDEMTGLIGAWLMVVGLVVATVAGAVATARNYRTEPSARS